MKIAIIAFDQFTDIDLWLMWDLLNRVKNPGWEVKILGESSSHISQTGIPVSMHGPLSDANDSDAVLFISGPGTRQLVQNQLFLNSFQLCPRRQMIGSMCSGALLLAALGILKPGQKATTYPTAKRALEVYGVEVVEQAFVQTGNIATAAGCLAAQFLVGWVIERLAGKAVREAVLESIQPVGEGLYFETKNLESRYSSTLI